jgi:hypothetical protein
MKKFTGLILAVLAMFALSVSPSFAALAASVAPAFASLLTDSLALIDLAWTVVVPVVSGFIIIRLFKSTASHSV